jgi:hypothetical protein
LEGDLAVVTIHHDTVAYHQPCLHICELVARQLDAVNQYLVDVRQQLVVTNTSVWWMTFWKR